MENPIVTLLSDFGYSDPYVGVMKGVILSICPQARLVDLTHGVGAHQVVEGAVALESAYRYFPAGTVHVAVVDPGVGTERRALAARAGEWSFVAPDNGILTPILEAHPETFVVALEERAYHLPQISRTFAGRDVFAPSAAYIAAGAPLKDLGPEVRDPVRLDLPKPVLKRNKIEAHVIYIDRFGDCITDLKEADFESWRKSKAEKQVVVRAAGEEIAGMSQAYETVPKGRLLAIFSSSGRLEIAANRASATDLLGIHIGDSIEIITQ